MCAEQKSSRERKRNIFKKQKKNKGEQHRICGMQQKIYGMKYERVFSGNSVLKRQKPPRKRTILVSVRECRFRLGGFRVSEIVDRIYGCLERQIRKNEEVIVINERVFQYSSEKPRNSEEKED